MSKFSLVDEDVLQLTHAIDTVARLAFQRGIPVQIDQEQMVAADQVEAAAAGRQRQQHDHRAAVDLVKGVDALLSK
jgi:hypothetical protein